MTKVVIIMSKTGRFHIPSVKEMKAADDSGQKTVVNSLFHNRQSGQETESRSLDRAATCRNLSGTSAVSSATVSTGSSTVPPGLCSATTSPATVTADGHTEGASSTTEGSEGTGSSSTALNQNKTGKTNSLIVSGRQRGNPILKFVRNVPWEFGDIVADYQLGQTSCALFLSLKYHNLNPNYIHERLKQLGYSFQLRVLLVLVDINDPHHSLKEIAKICMLSDCTLILAFSTEEAGRYLETFKSYENKPPDLIMERPETNVMARMTDCLTKARRINKTDVITLMSAFGSFEKIVEADEEDLSLCPGLGPQKAQKLYSVLHEPFLKAKKKERLSDPGKTASPKKKVKESS